MSDAILRFYADRRNHSGVGVSTVYRDGGRLARQALGECLICGGLGLAPTGRRIVDQDGPYDEMVTCDRCHGAGFEGAGYVSNGREPVPALPPTGGRDAR